LVFDIWCLNIFTCPDTLSFFSSLSAFCIALFLWRFSQPFILTRRNITGKRWKIYRQGIYVIRIGLTVFPCFWLSLIVFRTAFYSSDWCMCLWTRGRRYSFTWQVWGCLRAKSRYFGFLAVLFNPITAAYVELPFRSVHDFFPDPLLFFFCVSWRKKTSAADFSFLLCWDLRRRWNRLTSFLPWFWNLLSFTIYSGPNTT